MCFQPFIYIASAVFPTCHLRPQSPDAGARVVGEGWAGRWVGMGSKNRWAIFVRNLFQQIGYGWDKYQKHKRHKQRWAYKVYPEAGSSPKYPGDPGEIGDIPSEVHKTLANELASAQDRAKLTQRMAREFAKVGCHFSKK